MDTPPFEVSIHRENSHPIVRVRGEIDFATAPLLQDALQEAIAAGASEIILDFQEVTFFDSEGLKVLLTTYRHLRDKGGSVQVRGCSRFVAKTFEILGVEAHFGVCNPESKNQQ